MTGSKGLARSEEKKLFDTCKTPETDGHASSASYPMKIALSIFSGNCGICACCVLILSQVIEIAVNILHFNTCQ